MATGEVWRVASGRVTRHQVALGSRGLTMTEIASGRQSGDWILADAPLEEGERVRVLSTGQPADSVDSATRKQPPARFD